MRIAIEIPKAHYENLAKIANTGKEPLGYWERVVMNGVPLPKGHGRLIDADAFAKAIQEVSKRQKYEEVKIDEMCTVADVLQAVVDDLKGDALCGYELCPTIIPADKEDCEGE